jgi:hypothetical protein
MVTKYKNEYKLHAFRRQNSEANLSKASLETMHEYEHNLFLL